MALELEHIRNEELSLACGDGSIIFKYDSAAATLVDIRATGDKFVRTLMSKTKARLAVEGDAQQPCSLEHALEIFSDVAKLLGCGEMTDDDDDDNESDADAGHFRDVDDDYTYEDCSQGIGNVSPEWMSAYYQVPPISFFYSLISSYPIVASTTIIEKTLVAQRTRKTGFSGGKAVLAAGSH